MVTNRYSSHRPWLYYSKMIYHVHYKPVTETLLPVVAFDDAVGLILFSISFSIAQVFAKQQAGIGGAEISIVNIIFILSVNPNKHATTKNNISCTIIIGIKEIIYFSKSAISASFKSTPFLETVKVSMSASFSSHFRVNANASISCPLFTLHTEITENMLNL